LSNNPSDRAGGNGAAGRVILTWADPVGHPAMRRMGGVPGMATGGVKIGRLW
jgi:hypothetical protein